MSMGAYEPKYLYSDQVSATFSATTTGGQTLVVSGNGTLGPAGADSNAFVGKAAHDVAANGRGSYFPRGKVHITIAAGAITAGDRVNTGAAGTVKTAAAAVANIGVALTTAADGAAVEWMEI